MSELLNFAEKLSACDTIVLTPINEGRFYCRFYSNGLYHDRMFIKDLSLQEELLLLSEDDEIIDKDSVSRLKEKYRNVADAANNKEEALKNEDGKR